MSTKSLEELEALKARMETDMRRVRMVDGFSNNLNGTPLMKNYQQVQQEIEALKTKTTVTTEVLQG